MKKVFLPARSRIAIVLSEDVKKELPEKVGLLSNIQHLHQLPELKEQLPGAVVGGQVLGCNAMAAEKIADQVDAFLYIGTGEFHPSNVGMTITKPLYCYDPIAKTLEKVSDEKLTSYRKRRQGAYLKFAHAKSVGILVSVKPGQHHLEEALALKKRGDKEYFLFLFDTVNALNLADFSFIDAWVNSACPRIVDGTDDMLTLREIKLFEEGKITS